LIVFILSLFWSFLVMLVIFYWPLSWCGTKEIERWVILVIDDWGNRMRQWVTLFVRQIELLSYPLGRRRYPDKYITVDKPVNVHSDMRLQSPKWRSFDFSKLQSNDKFFLGIMSHKSSTAIWYKKEHDEMTGILVSLCNLLVYLQGPLGSCITWLDVDFIRILEMRLEWTWNRFGGVIEHLGRKSLFDV
jgi:hypothetical protein